MYKYLKAKGHITGLKEILSETLLKSLEENVTRDYLFNVFEDAKKNARSEFGADGEGNSSFPFCAT